jgi:hypothetical protein
MITGIKGKMRSRREEPYKRKNRLSTSTSWKKITETENPMGKLNNKLATTNSLEKTVQWKIDIRKITLTEQRKQKDRNWIDCDAPTCVY